MRKTALIYLAAGNSRRFGRNKLLYEVDGRPMYLHLLERLMEIADADKRYELLVVTQYQEIRETVDNFRKEGRRVFCVWSPESRKGVSFSIRAALSHIGKSDRMWTGETSAPVDIRSCAFFVADQPWLTKTTVEGFLAQMADAEIEKTQAHNLTVTKTAEGITFQVPYKEFGPFEIMWLNEDEGGTETPGMDKPDTDTPDTEAPDIPAGADHDSEEKAPQTGVDESIFGWAVAAIAGAAALGGAVIYRRKAKRK